jgi:N-acetylneuraminic acid mutarotase
MLVLLVLVSVFVLSAQIAVAQVQSLGRWFTRAPLPTPRQEMPLALLDGKIFVPGGFVQGGAGSSIIEIFDPATNRWSTFASLPTALNHLAMVALNGKLFVVGGYSGSGFFPTNKIYEYDFQKAEWNLKTDMPTPRGAHIAVAFEGKIYAIGGADGSNALNSNEVYDPATGQWSTLAPMPTAREHLAAAVIDSLIYVVGGRAANAGGQLVNLGNLEAYSPATNTWHSLELMPTARGGLAAAAMNGKLYVFGGEFFGSSGSGVFAQNEEYNPAANTWRAVQPMRTPRHGMNAVTVGDTIFVIGGGPRAGFGVTSANEGFTFAGLSTGSEDEPAVISDFALSQNYPNPFNAGTQITYSLPIVSEVQLFVFNLHGQEVARLVNQIMPEGIHTVSFSSGQLATGVYYYTLRAGSYSHTKKMLLLR